MANNKEDKTLKSYYCGYCGNEFQQLVGTSSGKHAPSPKKGRCGVSSQVQCKICQNFLKTWGD